MEGTGVERNSRSAVMEPASMYRSLKPGAAAAAAAAASAAAAAAAAAWPCGEHESHHLRVHDPPEICGDMVGRAP